MTTTSRLPSTVAPPASRDKVIVVGCCLTGYAVIRALADKNLHIIALTYGENDVAHLSRYVTEVARCPAPTEEEPFVEFLLQQADRWGGALLLETSDSAAVTLSKNKETLSKHYRVATPEWAALKVFVEKEHTYALAARHGIPHPRSTPLYRMEDASRLSTILYPCILKPVHSSAFASRFHVKNFEVNNDREMAATLHTCLASGQPMILQEIIPGPDANLYKMQGYVNSRGTLVGRFFYRKLRQHPPQYGIARVGVSTAREPEVERLTEELLTRSNYRGYFSNEFKLDPRDGQLKLIENNCRMPRSGMLSLACGVNYPWLIYQDLVRNEQRDVTHYTVGTYWIDFWTDLYNSLFRRKKEAGIRLREYMAPYVARSKVFSDLNVADPGPFLRVAFGHLLRHGRGRRAAFAGKVDATVALHGLALGAMESTLLSGW